MSFDTEEQPNCPDCKEPMYNAGIPGEFFWICIEGCEDLTEKLAVIDPEQILNRK